MNQIRLARKQPTSSGHIHWNMKTLMRNDALDEALLKNVYAEPALLPETPWLGKTKPEKPALNVASVENGKLRVSWGSTNATKTRVWLFQIQSADGQWQAQILPGQHTSRMLEGFVPNVIALTAVDRLGNASAPAVVRMKQQAVASTHASPHSTTQASKQSAQPKKRLLSPKARN